ncbi:hypothetical protein, partial [uncultured Gemmiger sp.]|uniref:hypothetical protein n=1 Tax=uncultured Gemmiger sp. TaxID=1623490 RepID=UPI0025FF15D5
MRGQLPDISPSSGARGAPPSPQGEGFFRKKRAARCPKNFPAKLRRQPLYKIFSENAKKLFNISAKCGKVVSNRWEVFKKTNSEPPPIKL